MIHRISFTSIFNMLKQYNLYLMVLSC